MLVVGVGRESHYRIILGESFGGSGSRINSGGEGALEYQSKKQRQLDPEIMIRRN